MKRYKVVSLDVFQTLVNVQGRTGYVWRGILREDCTEQRAAELSAMLLNE